MKTSFCRCIAILFFLSVPCFAQEIANDSTARDLPQKQNIAVITLKNGNGVTVGDCEIISDRLRIELFNTGKINVMEREQMQEILKEQGFQASGACSDEACLVQMGQVLGVQKLVTGSLGQLGSMFVINLRIIDVKTAKIVLATTQDIKGSIEDVAGSVRSVALQLLGEESKVVEPVKKLSVNPVAMDTVPVIKSNTVPKEKTYSRGISLSVYAFPEVYNSFKIKKEYAGNTSFFYSSNQQPRDNINLSVKNTNAKMLPLLNARLRFVLDAQSLISEFVGIEYMTGRSKTFEKHTVNFFPYTDTNKVPLDFYREDDFKIVSVILGASLARTWYPIRIKGGALVNVNYTMRKWSLAPADNKVYSRIRDPLSVEPLPPALVSTIRNNRSFLANYYDTKSGSVGGFGFAVEGTIGGELLLGKHVGLGVNGVFRIMRTVMKHVELNTTINETIEMLSPGIGAEANYYF